MSRNIATPGDQAIYRDKDGLQLIVANATERGLAIPLTTSVQDFTKIGTALTSMENWSGWALGDWVVALKEAQGEAARQIMSQVFVDPSENKVKWIAVVERVCRAFPPSERVFDLSFGHYYEVVTLDKKTRDDILCYAKEHKSSTVDVRLYVRTKKEEAAKAEAKSARSVSPSSVPPTSPASEHTAVRDQDDSTNGGDDHLDAQLSISVGGVELVEEIIEAEQVEEDIPDSKPQRQISSIPSIPLEPLVIYQIDPLGVFEAVRGRFTSEQMIELESVCHQHNSREVEPITKSVKKKTKAKKQDEPAVLVDPVEDFADDVPVRTLDEPVAVYEPKYEESEDYKIAMAALESGVPSDDVE
jgi:hypothetical protein